MEKNKMKCSECNRDLIEWSFLGYSGQYYCKSCNLIWVSLSSREYAVFAGRIKSVDQEALTAVMNLDYPQGYGGQNLDIYFGTQIKGRWNWLEDSSLAIGGKFFPNGWFEPYYVKDLKKGVDNFLIDIDLSGIVPKMPKENSTYPHLLGIQCKNRIREITAEIESAITLIPTKAEPKVQTKVKKQKLEKYSWDDVGGYESVKQELREAILLPLMEQKLVEKYRFKPVKGILLYGPPGCGKTLLAKVVASSLNINFISYSCAEIFSKWYGESAKNVANMFDEARSKAPCVLFLDEVDALIPPRGSGSGSWADQEDIRVASTVLSQIDGLEALKGVIILGATNRPEGLDPAILRPGRFDRKIFIPPPDFEARKPILTKKMEKVPASKINYEELARVTENYSGADLTELCNQAKLFAIRDSIGLAPDRKVTMEDFRKALKIMRPSLTPDMLKYYEDTFLSSPSRVYSHIT